MTQKAVCTGTQQFPNLSVWEQNQNKSFKVRVPTRPDQFDKYW